MSDALRLGPRMVASREQRRCAEQTYVLLSEYDALAARLADAERERDALRELLLDIQDDLKIGAHPHLYKDRIDAALERTPEPAQPGGRVGT